MNNLDNIDWMKIVYLVMHAAGIEEITVTNKHYDEMHGLTEQEDPLVVLLEEAQEGTVVRLLPESIANKLTNNKDKSLN